MKGRSVPAARAGEARRLRRELRRRADRARGRFLRSYLGSPLPVLGVRGPEFRTLLRESRDRFRLLPTRSVRALARELWRGRTYEERWLAIALLHEFTAPDDPRTWRLLDRWVDSATGWGLSDSLASGPVARSVAAVPTRFRELLSWTRSSNLWRRRAAAYALHDWVLEGELDRPFRLLERLVSDPEFWVQRAVGTWLRECWKQDPARTDQFLRRHARALAPVTITVATERAPQSLRNELRGARTHHRRGPGRGRAY